MNTLAKTLGAATCALFIGGTASAATLQLAQSGQPGLERTPGAADNPAERSADPANPAESTNPAESSTAPMQDRFAGIEPGADVVNAEGETIGEVKEITDSGIIVSVGGFLGMGEHDVMLSHNQLEAMGSGEDAKLKTTLSEAELKRLPKHEAQ